MTGGWDAPVFRRLDREPEQSCGDGFRPSEGCWQVEADLQRNEKLWIIVLAETDVANVCRQL